MLVNSPSPQFQATNVPLVLDCDVVLHFAVEAVDHDVAREDQSRPALGPGLVQVDETVGVGVVDLAISPR